MTFDDLAQKFANWRKESGGYIADCPACKGHKGTLSIDTKCGVACALGCEVADILTARGLSYLLPESKPNGKGNGKGNGKKARPFSIVPPAPPPPTSAEPPQGSPPQKPMIDISVDDMPILNAECWKAIEQQNKPPALFCYGSGMIRTRYDYADDSIILDQMNADIMRHELSQMADWIVMRTNKRTGESMPQITKPPMYIVKDVLSSRVIPLPRLNRVVTVPVFAPDGTLQTKPGYSKAAGVIYAPPRGYKSLDVPDKIEAAHVDESKGLIEELICDFPFTCDNAGDSPDHDNAVALFLLPFVRDMIDGPTPLHLIDASMPGSGKGLLATSLLFPGLGKIAGAPMPAEDNELRKHITSEILDCRPIIFFDNVNHSIDSGTLAAALTLETWNDRILGQSATANAKIQSLWLATGNNVALSGEIVRRTIRIRLSPQTDRPEEREGFKHDDQVEWVTANRPRLVWAAHVLIKNAIQQGLPRPKIKNVGSFERWSRLLGSILECAGYTHFLGNYRALQDGSDIERQHLSLFAMSWHEWAQREGLDIVTTRQILPIAENIDGLPIKGTTEKGRLTSLGMWLKKKHELITEYIEDDPTSENAIFKLKILNMGLGKGKDRGSQMWRIECVETIPR